VTGTDTHGGSEVGREPVVPTRVFGLELELPEHGTGVRAARRAASAPAPTPAPERDAAPRGPSRRWMIGFASTLAAAVVVAGGLAFVGVQTLRESSAGRRVSSADPAEPGFEGLLDPTPTLLVVHQQGTVVISAAVVALANGDAGGSVILLPPSVKVGDGPDAVPLSVLAAFGATLDDLRGAAEAVTGVGIQDVVVVDDARWAELVAPVSPLHLQNPDDVGDFEEGALELAADEVGDWLRARRTDESELARLYRQQLVWEAWVGAVAASDDPAAIPGELDTGLGRFVRGLAAGPLTVTTLPVIDEVDEAGDTVYRVDRDALRAVITDLVPFPIGSELAPRTRVRLLDGAGQPDHVQRSAPAVVSADATIVVVGNADAFDYGTTEIRYHQPSQRAAAERLQTALGAGTVVEDVRPIDAFDVTIVLGTDV
jgi:hypothetical protein